MRDFMVETLPERVREGKNEGDPLRAVRGMPRTARSGGVWKV